MTEFLVVFLALYIWHGLGVTIGYHRLLSHRSFTCIKPLEYFFVLGGYLAFEGSPIWWATMHRAHHRHVDTELDPHSPRFGGVWNAYVGWTMYKTYPEHIDPNTQGKDLLKDPIYRFLDQGGDWTKAHMLNFAFGIGLRVAMYFVFGWQVALASILASVAVLQIPLLLNVVCHMPKAGYKNYGGADDSVNVWWVAVLAMGEGWHNNHHMFPGSARSGLKLHEIDVSWIILRVCKWFNWVGYMNEAVVPRFEAKQFAAKQKAALLAQLPEMPKLPEFQMPEMPQLPEFSMPRMPEMPKLPEFQMPEFQMPELADLKLPKLPEMPKLSDFQMPEIAMLQDLQLPELPQLPNLADLHLPELPELPEIPGLQKPNLAQS